MNKRNRCRKVRKLITALPECKREQTLRLISEHLSECEACKSVHARLEKMEAILLRSKFQVNELARQSRMSQSRVIAQMAPLAKGRARRLRAVWAGAAALLLAIAGAALFFPFDRGDHVAPTVRPPVTRTPAVTLALAAESSSHTLRGVAEVLRRREAPSLGLPHVRPSLAPESFTPPFLRQCAIESDARLGGIVQSRIDLSTASAPPRQSLLPRPLQRATLESDDTLGRILRSRINLTRREDS